MTVFVALSLTHLTGCTRSRLREPSHLNDKEGGESPSPSPREDRIVKRVLPELEKHPESNDYQYVVLIDMIRKNGDRDRCAGTLLEGCWVVTSASCLDNIAPDGVKDMRVAIRIGEVGHWSHMELLVSGFIQHENFTEYYYSPNNIALIKLDCPLECKPDGPLRALRLPQLGYSSWDSYYRQSTVEYGSHGLYDDHFPKIFTTRVKPLPWTNCFDDLHPLSARNKCFSVEGIHDFCEGALGGPVTWHAKDTVDLVGVGSFASNKQLFCEHDAVWFYTPVFPHNDWLRSKMKTVFNKNE